MDSITKQYHLHKLLIVSTDADASKIQKGNCDAS